jgi:hypothetical protein
MAANGAVGISMARRHGAPAEQVAMPAFSSIRDQWQGPTAAERVKKTLFVVSVLSAGLYYLFIGVLLLARYLG